MSLYIAIGAWAPPKIQHLSTGGWRVCLGWVAVCVIPQDIEQILGVASQALRRAELSATPTEDTERHE